MNENSEGWIDPFRLLNTRRKNRLRKPLRQKTKARALYEEQNPCISTRIPQAVYFETLLGAKTAGLKLNQYVSNVLSKSNFDIEKIRNKAFADGQASMQSEVETAHQRGLKEGAVADGEKIIETAYNRARSESGIDFTCHICHRPIFIERHSILHRRVVELMETEGWVHHSCLELKRIYSRPLEPQQFPIKIGQGYTCGKIF